MLDMSKFPNGISPINETEFRLAKHLRKMLHLDCENNMQCLNKNCDGHYKPICDKCEYPGWISVKDIPPPNGWMLICYRYYADPNILCSDFGLNIEGVFTSAEVIRDVTHWMPLPQPPKK